MVGTPVLCVLHLESLTTLGLLSPSSSAVSLFRLEGNFFIFIRSICVSKVSWKVLEPSKASVASTRHVVSGLEAVSNELSIIE